MKIIVFLVALMALLWGANAIIRSRSQSSESPPSRGGSRSGRVCNIINGDTIVVVENERGTILRLNGIDAPHTSQPWGDIAKHCLAELIDGRNVRIEEHGQNGFGRTLATIFVRESGGQWTNVNARMVSLGHAWVGNPSGQNLPKDRHSELRTLQREAQKKKLGLWNTADPVPPWEWKNGDK